jgi:hypothetical protein
MSPPAKSHPAGRYQVFGIVGAGVLAVALGSTVIIAWQEHWSRVLQIVLYGPPMQYNTAVCFILCGAGLLLLNGRHAAGAA